MLLMSSSYAHEHCPLVLSPGDAEAGPSRSELRDKSRALGGCRGSWVTPMLVAWVVAWARVGPADAPATPAPASGLNPLAIWVWPKLWLCTEVSLYPATLQKLSHGPLPLSYLEHHKNFVFIVKTKARIKRIYALPCSLHIFPVWAVSGLL